MMSGEQEEEGNAKQHCPSTTHSYCYDDNTMISNDIKSNILY